jgi:hypothetical protein
VTSQSASGAAQLAFDEQSTQRPSRPSQRRPASRFMQSAASSVSHVVHSDAGPQLSNEVRQSMNVAQAMPQRCVIVSQPGLGPEQSDAVAHSTQRWEAGSQAPHGEMQS